MIPEPRVIAWSEMESPIGPLTLAITPRGICYIDFGAGERTQVELKVWARRRFRSVRLERLDRELEHVKKQLAEYFDGKRRRFDLPVDLYGTPFQLRVWRELKKIPYGEVRSYKELARAIGVPQGRARRRRGQQQKSRADPGSLSPRDRLQRFPGRIRRRVVHQGISAEAGGCPLAAAPIEGMNGSCRSLQPLLGRSFGASPGTGGSAPAGGRRNR